MHVLITGGAGFIGSHLVERHLSQGDHVHVVDDLSTGSLDNIASFTANDNFRFSHANLLCWEDLDTAVAWADRIYHLAAVVGVKSVLDDPVKVMNTNLAGTDKVLQAVHHGGWNPEVVITSSSEVYGFNTNESFDESSDIVLRSGGRLRWTYAITKLSDEYLAFSYVRKYGLNITIARLFNTIGPRQTGRYGMVVPTFVKQAVRNEPITIYGDGLQTRSFSDVKDTVEALYLLAECSDSKGEVVNVGNDQEITIKGLAELVRERANSDSELQFISYRDAYGEEFEDVQHRRPILTKLHKITGFRPQKKLVDTIDVLIALKKSELGVGQ